MLYLNPVITGIVVRIISEVLPWFACNTARNNAWYLALIIIQHDSESRKYPAVKEVLQWLHIFTSYLNTVCEHLGENTTNCGIQHKLKFADKSIETTKFAQICLLTAQDKKNLDMQCTRIKKIIEYHKLNLKNSLLFMWMSVHMLRSNTEVLLELLAKYCPGHWPTFFKWCCVRCKPNTK